MADDFIKVASPQVGEEEVAAVREVLLSGNFISGVKVKEFETRFAEYIGVEHAIAVDNGTAALHIALQALGVGRGDEVIVPPLTFFATITAVIYVGAKPVFADIDLDDLCLSPKSTESKISSRTKAIIPVHLFGAPAKMDEFMEIATSYGVPVIEDCAQAHGSELQSRKVGSFGVAGAFSFFATKHITTGEGGMITTHNSELARLCKIIRNHGMTDRDTHEYLGFNNRMTEIEAAMGMIQLAKLDALNQQRIKNSEYLIDSIQKLSWAYIPVPPVDGKHTYFWCPLVVRDSHHKDIDDLKSHLSEHRISFRHRYPLPLYRQPVLKRMNLNYEQLHLPHIESVAGKVIGLPNHPGLTKKDLDRIIKALKIF